MESKAFSGETIKYRWNPGWKFYLAYVRVMHFFFLNHFSKDSEQYEFTVVILVIFCGLKVQFASIYSTKNKKLSKIHLSFADFIWQSILDSCAYSDAGSWSVLVCRSLSDMDWSASSDNYHNSRTPSRGGRNYLASRPSVSIQK